MAQLLRLSTPFPEDQGFTLPTNWQFTKGSDALFVLHGHYMHVVDRHTCRHMKNSTFKEIEKSINYNSFVPSFCCTETEIHQFD